MTPLLFQGSFGTVMYDARDGRACGLCACLSLFPFSFSLSLSLSLSLCSPSSLSLSFFVSLAKLLCEHVCFMCVFKPYLDSLPSESDRCGFVVRFGLNYLTQKRFGPAFAPVRSAPPYNTKNVRRKRPPPGQSSFGTTPCLF